MAQGQTTVTQDLSFDTLGVLRGSVRFGSGAAASSGTVTITGGSPAVNVVVPIAGDGTYSGVALPAGTYTIQAASLGRNGTTTGVLVTVGATTTADVTLKSFAGVRVTVKRFDGTPVVNATVIVIGVDGQHPQAGTDVNGIATLNTFVAEGPFTVQVFGPQLIGTASGVVLPADDNRTIDVAVTSTAGKVTGRVFDANGVTPIQTGLVQLVAGNTVASSPIAADGSYAINTIPPGTYTATITTTGRSLQVQGVVVNAAQLTTANFKFPVHATVRVTVRRDGAPLAGVTIYLQNADAFASLGVTGASGSLSAPNVAEGPFTVYAQSFDSVILNVVRTGAVAAADDGGVVDVAIETTVGTVSGTVFIADGVTPAAVRVRPAEGSVDRRADRQLVDRCGGRLPLRELRAPGEQLQSGRALAGRFGHHRRGRRIVHERRGGRQPDAADRRRDGNGLLRRRPDARALRHRDARAAEQRRRRDPAPGVRGRGGQVQRDRRRARRRSKSRPATPTACCWGSHPARTAASRPRSSPTFVSGPPEP